MINKLNDWLADILAEGLSSMACFWVITTLVVVVLFCQRPESLVGWITYISTAIFQASALPVLGFVANKQGAAQQALLQETHDAEMGQLGDIKSLIEEVHGMHGEIRDLVSQVHIKVGAGEVEVSVET